MTRRGILGTLMAAFAASFGPVVIAKEEKPKEQSKDKWTEAFPWHHEFTREPEWLYDPYTGEYSMATLPGNQVKLFYRGNLFCVLETALGGVKTVHGGWLFDVLKQMRDKWTIKDVHYLYLSNANFHALVQMVTNVALTQKNKKDWCLDDIIRFRADPLGSIMYDLAQSWR